MTTYAIAPYLRIKILEHVLRNTSFSSSSAWLALYQGNPLLSPTSEISGGSYSRVQVPFTVSGSIATNTSVINFPRATANWGTVNYFGLRDAATTGNLLFYGQLTTPKTVYNGNLFFINASELSVNFGGAYSVYLANKLLNHVLNNTTYTSPGLDVFVALYTTMPTRNDTGGTEVNAVNYDRLRVSGSGWTPTSVPAGIGEGGDSTSIIVSTSNTITLNFCEDTQYSWGILKGLCLRDAATSGNQLFGGSFNYETGVVVGDSYRIQIGDLTVRND